MMNKATFCFIFLFPFIVACNTSDSPSTTPDEGGGVGLVVINDGDAETLLGKARAEKLEKLKRAFNTSVELTLNRRTNAIKSIGFVYDKDATSVADLKTHAESFVANYLDLIDPNINVGELIVTPERQCYSNLKDFGSIRFDRVIGGTAVLGSHLTLHYGEKGLLVKVENSLASISRSTLQKDKAKVSLKDGISKMMGQRKVKVVGTQKITPVIMPVMSQGETRLVGGELVVWSTGAGGANDNDGVMAGVVLTSGEVVGPWDTGVDNYNTGGIGDVHLDERTELPDFITFRSKGGIAVNSAGVLDDPAEIVYRFLEQYPSVFRSGDTRCQFRLKGAKTLAELEKVTYVKMQQTIAGYRVFGGELVFEVEDGNVIMSAQGHILPEASMPLSAKINAGSALEEAKQQLRKQAKFIAEVRREAFIEQADKANWRGTELLIFPGQLHTGKPTDSRLAFKVQLDNYVIFIDAINSKLLYAYNIRSNANVVVEGNGLTEGFFDRSNYVIVNVDGTPVGVPAAGNTDIPFTIADVGTSAAFFAAHGWTGLNGRGSDFTAITNLVLGLGCPNAFFEPYISDNAFFCLGMGQNDVVPHEFTHGVTAYSSALIYLDESGALNESYSDIMSNLAFPDLIPAGSPPGTLPGWIVGETGGFGGCAGAFRNMAAPGACGDPGNWSGYLSRTDLGCAPADIFGTGPGCDSGGVHSNSGINNRAHVLMSDGLAGVFAGMGRSKMRTLAFDVLTNRLGLFSRMLDAALATRASCELFMSGGFAIVPPFGSPPGTPVAPFVAADCDVVPLAFNSVGLDPDLVSSWVPPMLGFNGTIPRFVGETTDNRCLITDVAVQMITPSGVLDASVLTTGAATINYLGMLTATVPITAPPIGSTAKGHLINWTSSFGISPAVSSSLTAPPPPPAVDCFTPVGMTPVQRVSATMVRGVIPNGWGGTVALGSNPSTMNPVCVLNNTEVEIVDGNNQIIAGPGTTAQTRNTIWVPFPITVTRDVAITVPPPGLPNLSATVNWGFSVVYLNTRFRLRYYISQPAGVACTP